MPNIAQICLPCVCPVFAWGIRGPTPECHARAGEGRFGSKSNDMRLPFSCLGNTKRRNSKFPCNTYYRLIGAQKSGLWKNTAKIMNALFGNSWTTFVVNEITGKTWQKLRETRLVHLGPITFRFVYGRTSNFSFIWFDFWTCPRAPKPTFLIFGDTKTPKNNQGKSLEHFKKYDLYKSQKMKSVRFETPRPPKFEQED